MTDDQKKHLTVYDHDRDAAGMTYVYPVVSRRAGGVSVGINLNPNNACNWQCIYCQVPDLSRGVAPPIDIDQLRTELRTLLHDIVEGDYLARHVPDPAARRLMDIAFSGNGEPTTCKRFDEVVAAVVAVARDFGLAGQIKFTIISNGSMAARPEVQAGLRTLSGVDGEIWFKVDAGTEAGRATINQVTTPNRVIVDNLVTASQHIRTRIQTCVFALDGAVPGEDWARDYLALLDQARERGAQIHDVLLYGLARPSMQPAAARLDALTPDQLAAVADRLRAAGYAVSAHG